MYFYYIEGDIIILSVLNIYYIIIYIFYFGSLNLNEYDKKNFLLLSI